MTGKYNKRNFHNQTFCIWNEVHLSEIQDLKINYKSKSGSAYIFNDEGVFRISNHWGRASNCRWRLISTANYKNQNTTVGFAKWSDFLPNDEISKLFFVKIDFQTNEVNFYHKDAEEYDGKAILRNANNTAKTIKNLKMILNETSWAKHLNYGDLDILRKEICAELLNSDKSMVEIKRRFI